MSNKKPYIVIKPDGATHEITRECALTIQRRNWAEMYGWKIEENPAASAPEVVPQQHPIHIQPENEVKETKRPRRSKATDVDAVDVEAHPAIPESNEGDVQ